MYRLTDLCEYCEKGRDLKKKINKFVQVENSEFKDNDDIELIEKQFFEKAQNLHKEILMTQELEVREILELNYDKYKMIVQDIKDYQTILFHQNIAKSQRSAYNNYLKNSKDLKNKILIEIDFKQKFVIGMSPRQVNREFYNQIFRNIFRSCLGLLKIFYI